MKACKNCGAQLPDGAGFCHSCASSQLDIQQLEPPKKKNGKLRLPLILSAVIVLAAAFLLWPRGGNQSPEDPSANSPAAAAELPEESTEPSASPEATPPQEGGRTIRADHALDYEVEGQTYTLIACQSLLPITNGPDAYQFQVNHSISPDQRFYSSVRLFALSGGAVDSEEFAAHVESIQLSATAVNNSAPVDLEECWLPQDHPGSLYCCGYFFDSTTLDNQFIWEIRMKNGDSIFLEQQLHVDVNIKHVFHFSEYPMDSTQQLEELLDSIYEQIPTTDVVEIYLPPVVYEGGLVLDRRSINLYGCRDEATGRQTTFTGTLEASVFDPSLSEIVGIAFDGGGSGVGIRLFCSYAVIDCLFQNCSTAVEVGHNGWLIGWASSYIGNDVGISINNPLRSNITNTEYNDNLFENNGIAVQILNSYADHGFSFPGCTFRNNGVDIDNRTDILTDTSGAVME